MTKADARELRRFYVERAEEARLSRASVRWSTSCTFLKFVWKLNKDWLMKVPCFSLVVERLSSRVGHGALPRQHCDGHATSR